MFYSFFIPLPERDPEQECHTAQLGFSEPFFPRTFCLCQRGQINHVGTQVCTNLKTFSRKKHTQTQVVLLCLSFRKMKTQNIFQKITVAPLSPARCSRLPLANLQQKALGHVPREAGPSTLRAGAQKLRGHCHFERIFEGRGIFQYVVFVLVFILE